MSVVTKPDLAPDEAFIQQAAKDGRASIREVGMASLGEPDTRFQARMKHLDTEHVERLMQVVERGDRLAPAVVFRSGEGMVCRLILADGFHRHEVCRRVGSPTLRAWVIDAHPDRVEHEARLFATMCNRQMCLPREIGDIRKAAEMLFGDPECWSWTDARIGEHCGVCGHTVKLHRIRYAQDRNLPLPEIVTRSDGQPRQYNREKKEIPNVVERKREGRTTGYACNSKGKKIYLGSSKEKATIAAERIAGEKESRRHNLELKSLKYFLSARGFALDSCDCTFTSHPGLHGLHGHGTVLTSTDFKGAESVVSAIGCLRMLRLLMESPDARMVVVCYPEDGPRQLMDLAASDGIEFLTPVALAESLKCGAQGED
jgi:hypothetical protein